MRWMLAVSAAMLYVAFIVPFRAAGFVTAERDTCSVYSAQFFQLDLLVDLIFLLDVVFSAHTAFYRYSHDGTLVLIDEVSEVRSQYLQSRGFLLDILGVLPLEGTLCLLEKRLHERKGEDMTKITLPKNLVKVVQVFRISKLLRLHNWNRMSRLLDGWCRIRGISSWRSCWGRCCSPVTFSLARGSGSARWRRRAGG